MLKFTKVLILAIASLLSINNVDASTSSSNGCITFSVSQGTGCAWMCNYCANQLGTSNYYFTDGVCTYQTGGCVGNPIAGKQYTCCSASSSASPTEIDYDILEDEVYNDEL